MVLKLVESTDPILRQPTLPVAKEEISNLKPLIVDMFELLRVTGGIGLTASQVGINKSIFVIEIEGNKRVFINPEVLSASEILAVYNEGCLSMPGLKLRVKRSANATVTWTDETGTVQVSDLQGLWARVWLHEYDHTKGILITDRVSKLVLEMGLKKAAKQQRIKMKEMIK